MIRDPMVEFIVPMHNARGTISRTLGSLVDQHDVRWNAIVVDDGSTDGSATIVRGLEDARIRLYTQPNEGVSAARNRGFSLACAPFVCFLDADDTLEPGYIEELLPIAERSENGSVCACDYLSQNAARVLPPSITNDRAFSMDAYRALDCPPIMSVLHRRSVLNGIVRETKLFDETLDAFEDLDLLIRLRACSMTPCPWGFSQETLAHYWVSPGSLSSINPRVHACGLEILRRYVDTDQQAVRAWTLRTLAASLVADDRVGGEQRLNELGSLSENEVELLDSMLRWHVRRRYAVDESRLGGHASRVLAAAEDVLRAEPSLPLLRAFVGQWPIDRWINAVEVAMGSRPSSGRLVIYGLGRNGCQVMNACDMLATAYAVIDDDPQRIPGGVHALEVSGLTADDVVLVTPDDASRIIDRLGSLTPARVWTVASALRHTAGAHAHRAGV